MASYLWGAAITLTKIWHQVLTKTKLLRDKVNSNVNNLSLSLNIQKKTMRLSLMPANNSQAFKHLYLWLFDVSTKSFGIGKGMQTSVFKEHPK